jgi:hypothetical protein
MRRIQKFGKKIDLPSTAQIIHELKLMAAADAVRGALADAPDAERREQTRVFETLLARTDIQ